MDTFTQESSKMQLGSDATCLAFGDENTRPCCIDVSNICISYGHRIVVEDVSLQIHQNTVTAVIGPSGCGKSSFLCCLNRLTDLIPDCQVSGCVRFDWTNNSLKESPVALRRKVGMLFQKPNPFPFSIWRNLEFPLMQHGVTNRYERTARIETALVDVGLWEEVKNKLQAPAMTLSGGQQQRLCLARALILQPSILLMDEPCSALDPMSTQKIEELIIRLAKNRTIILVTHNIAQARRVADYVALFWNDGTSGRLVEHGAAKEIFERPKHDLTRAYLAFG